MRCGPNANTFISFDRPRALGLCDRSGMFFRHEDLRKQMAFRGNDLVWTGLMVYKDYLDIPNAQGLTPILNPNLIPCENPRPNTQYNNGEWWPNPETTPLVSPNTPYEPLEPNIPWT